MGDVRVLVTGATGYLGRVVVGRLQHADHQVSALVRGDAALPATVERRRGELLDPGSLAAAVDGVDAVLHLAAATGAWASVVQPARYYAVNTGGTAALLDALAQQTARTGRPARFLLASTAAVYGTPERQPISEDTLSDPPNPYAASKLAAEQLTEWQAGSGSIGAVTLRMFNVAGADGYRDPGDSRIITRAVAVAAGRLSHVDINGDGSAVRDFVHVRDAAAALVLALQACEPGRCRVFNVGATPASVADIVRTVEQVTGHPVATNQRPANPHEAPELRADSIRIRAVLGWRPERSKLTQIVADQWAAAQAQRPVPDAQQQ